MLLKIFVKRKAHGELIVNGFDYNNWIYEGDEIFYKDKVEQFQEEGKPSFESVVGKTFKIVNKDDKVTEVDFYPDSQGYEILNSNGVVVERFITPIN